MLGAGGIARTHAAYLREMDEVRVAAVIDPVADRAAALAGSCGARVYERLDTLLDEVDAVYVGTPHAFHAENSILCLRNGKHVLCEKAFALNAAEAARMIAVAREGALKVREVVLNHTEGFEGSEFKHGPNTILGFNTVFGPEQVDALLRRVGTVMEELIAGAAEAGLGADSMARLAQAVTDGVFSPTETLLSLSDRERTLLKKVVRREDFEREVPTRLTTRSNSFSIMAFTLAWLT